MKSVQFNNLAGEVTDKVRKHSRLIVEAFARDTEAEVKKLILRGSPSGEVYKVPGTQVNYRASAPGQAPAPRTGDLANSYQSQVTSESTSIVFSGLKYSRIEFGWGHVAPRPHLRPASDITLTKRDAIITRVLNQVGD